MVGNDERTAPGVVGRRGYDLLNMSEQEIAWAEVEYWAQVADREREAHDREHANEGADE